MISERCLSTLGKEKVEKMHFLTSYREIRGLLVETEEFVRLRDEEDAFPFDHYYDLRPTLQRIRVAGAWIEQNALFDLRRSLQTIHTVVSFLRHEEENARYPHLFALTEQVALYPEITQRIDEILNPLGEIRDHASPRLAEIRRELTTTVNGISRILHSILRKAQEEGIVEKDVSPTMRDGRLVIPVNPSHKRKIKGIVHDASASGKTLFIEPSAVVEANNRIRELEGEERREIIKILTLFTDFLRPYLLDLEASYDFLATIDFIQAKAAFASSIDGINPMMEDTSHIDWVAAVHPLLDMALKKQQKRAVPLDITLDAGNRILMISGPNAGGKSVCLKTVGLLQYMLQCGLLIPLKENSRAGLFEDILIDIGDEQSIENDLSTYSSHLMNMKFFEKQCGEKSLLLIDEFGSGTEPQIGAAIAEALLERFTRSGSFGVITTHYENLKHFANKHAGVVNGAMLYDRHQMQPLFSLSIGHPGSSFAVDIAHKIGLPEEVIARASAIVGSDYIRMDKYIQDISRDRRYWERKREEIRRERKRLDHLISEYETEAEGIGKRKKEILARAKEQARQLLSESNARIENTIREIREAQAEKERTREIRQTFNNFKKQLEEKEAAGHPTAHAADFPILSKQKKKKKKVIPVSPKEEKRLKVGDTVRLKGQNSAGKILEVSEKKATVAFGMIKSIVEWEKLERTTASQVKKEERNSNVREILHERKMNFKQDIDVRGMRGDEALQAVVYFIDDAVQLGITRVRILHGTGTGALREIIRDYLRTVEGVVHFQDEHVQFGGAGITVIDLI